MPQHKGGKSGNKTHGRSKAWCERYRARHQRERNKLKKVKRHLKKFPNDRAAELKRLELKFLV